jgi:mannosidase alpha-like ER degradation enhancer 1
MRTGQVVHQQFESLQAFWPALQVLAGDVGQAVETHAAFFSLWQQFGYLPESYLLASHTVHPSMTYYPLRPELAESTYALYRATGDPYYLQVGRAILTSLNGATRVPGGFAAIKDVKNPRILEDRMASYFLAETCKCASLALQLYIDMFK